MRRPELGELEVGQPVVVTAAPNDRRRGKSREDYTAPARITKVGRVWVEMERVGDGWPKSWRMRKDVQHEGSQYSGMNASFATIQQNEWDQTATWARGVLSEQKITVERDSPWRGREVELADLISKHLQDHPS